MSSHNKEIRNGHGTDLIIDDDSYIRVGKRGEDIAIRGDGKVFFFDKWTDLISTIERCPQSHVSFALDAPSEEVSDENRENTGT